VYRVINFCFKRSVRAAF